MVQEILFTSFYLILFNYVIYRYKRLQLKAFKPFVTNVLFTLKALAGVFIWLIYTFYYKDVQNNDVYKFYNDAVILRNVARQSPEDFVQIICDVGNNDP